jgi:hypothetical protein
MRLILTAFVCLFFTAETQAGWLFGCRSRCEPCPPPCFSPCPQFYYECYPCVPLYCPPVIPPQPDEVVLSEEKPSGGGGVPYVDWDFPPTGHDTYFGGGSLFIPHTFFLPPPSYGGFRGFGGFGGWGGGGHTTHFPPPSIYIGPHYGDTINNYTVINYGDTIINNYTTVVNNYNTTVINNYCDHQPWTCPPHGTCNPTCYKPPGCHHDCPDDCDGTPGTHDCPPTVATPAPGSLVLLGSGLPVVFLLRRRMR